MSMFTRSDRPSPANRMGPTVATPGTTIQPVPHERREEVRSANYPNREVEEATIQSVDEQVFDKVRIHEQFLIEQGRSVMEDRKADEAAAVDIIVSLRSEVLYPLLDGALPTEESAARYKSLLAQAEYAKSRLAAADAEAASVARKVVDPYGSLMDVYRKFPTLRPVIR